MSYLMPRISAGQAIRRVSEWSGYGVEELSEKLERERPWEGQWDYAATGGTRLPLKRLAELRGELVSLARDAGFPTGSNRDQRRQFDRQAMRVLWTRLSDVVTADLMRQDAWAFMAAVLLPDLVAWRFPPGQERRHVARERYLGGYRNVFQRLWVRAYLLHDAEDVVEPFRLADSLSEDEAVGLIERPGVSANPVVARAIAQMLLTVTPIARTKGLTREDVHREAMLRIRTRIPVLCLEALSERELKQMVASAYRNGISALERKAGQARAQEPAEA